MTGLVLEQDIQVGSSRLLANLLIFDSSKSLQKMWKELLGKSDLGRSCLGAVNGMFCEVMNFENGKETHYLEVDQRYFSIIGLIVGHLSMEIICHESVHAAFNYVKRVRRTPWDKHAKSFDEEAICYPAGRIAAAINHAVHTAGLYGR